MIDDTPPPPQSPLLTIIAVLIVTIAIIGGLILLLSSRPQPVAITINPPQPTATPMPTATPAPITVYVTGAVAEPESLLTLPPGSRVEAALEAAGGATRNADLTRINLAAPLRDGDQVHVPSVEEADTALATPSGGSVISINDATAEELTALPGVGETLATRIVEFRAANGRFERIEDLDAVEGVGPALLTNLASTPRHK